MNPARPLGVVAIAFPMIIWGMFLFGMGLNESCDWLIRGYYQTFLFDSPLWLVPSLGCVGLGVALLRGHNTARLISSGVCLVFMLLAILLISSDTPIYVSIALFVLSFLGFNQLFRPRTIAFFAESDRIISIFGDVIPIAPKTLVCCASSSPQPSLRYWHLHAPWPAYLLSWLAMSIVVIPTVIASMSYPFRAERYRSGYEQVIYGATTDEVYGILGRPTELEFCYDENWEYSYCEQIGWDRWERHNSDGKEIVLTFRYTTPLIRDTWMIGFDREGRAVGKVSPQD